MKHSLRRPRARAAHVTVLLLAVLWCLAAPTSLAAANASVSITGILRTPDGLPAAEAEIWAQEIDLDDGSATTNVAHDVTGADGAFALSGLIPGRHYVLDVIDVRAEPAYPWGYLTMDPRDPQHPVVRWAHVFVPGDAGIHGLEATVERAATISGTLRWSDGSPAANIDVVGQTADDGSGFGWQSRVARTDAQGAYTIVGLEPTRYVVRIAGRGIASNSYVGAPGGEPARHEEARDVDVRSQNAVGVDATVPLVGLPAEQFVLSPPLAEPWRGGVVEVDDGGALSWFTLRDDGQLDEGVALRGGLAGQTVYAPGEWLPDGHGARSDILTVDARGRMFLYPGGVGPLGAPRQIGHGWGSLRVMPVGDLDDNGCSDLLAVSSAGQLLRYTSDCAGGFQGPARAIGQGWNGYDLHAPGDLNRDGHPDILSVDGVGRLWMYAGKGDGTFLARKQVGKGWSTYTLAAGADLDADGSPDIVGRDDATGRLYLYRGLGGGLFGTKRLVATGW